MGLAWAAEELPVDLRLSVLDQSPIPEGLTGSQALHNTIDLARHADALGYHRYWVSEHHGGLSLAGPAPEALIPAIASVTSHLRVGSGGVMLPHYSPLKVAEQFSLLAGLFPGRIDLGLGRASGTDSLTAYALQRDRSSQQMLNDFPSQLTELLGLPGGHPPGRPRVRAPRGQPARSARGAGPVAARQLAAVRDLGGRPRPPIRLRRLHQPEGRAERPHLRREFQPGKRRDAAEVAVAAWILVADTEEEARYLALSHRVAMNALRRGRPMPFVAPDKAERILRSEGEDPDVAGAWPADDPRHRRSRRARASRSWRATTAPAR